jgi:lambda family phage tail tape measure protein
MDLVKGATSVEEAFRNMLFNIVEQIYQAQVVDPLAESAGSFLTNLIGGITKTQADGGAWSNGVQMFAKGGVVSSATMFGHSGGLGVMGEAGPEAIMPLKRGRDGKLGVAAAGGDGGSQDVIINQSFTFAANGDESVKRIIAEAAPSIAEMTKRQVLQARLRGGQFKAAFK